MTVELIVSKNELPAFKEAAKKVGVNITKTEESEKHFVAAVQYTTPHQLFSLGCMKTVMHDRNEILDKWKKELEQ